MSLRSDAGKVRHDLWASPCLSGGHVGLRSHACPIEGLTELLFRALSVLAIFQQSLFIFFSPSICSVVTFYYPCFAGGKKTDLLVVRLKVRTPLSFPHKSAPVAVCPPTPSRSPSLLSRHCALFILHVPTKAHLKTDPSENRPLPFLIVASLSSSVIMSELNYTLWPLPYRQPLLTFHTRRHASARTSLIHKHTKTFSKFPALRANWLKLAQRDNERKSTVKA